MRWILVDENKIGNILNIIGIITIIFGIICSIIAAKFIPIVITFGTDLHTIQELYNWPLAILGSASSFILGMLIIGLSEIVNLLHRNSLLLGSILRKITN